MLHGDWNQFEGQVFREWREDVHVIDVVIPPKHWDRVYGFDWGWASPFVFGQATRSTATRARS
jgi:hypothetical protein